MQRLADMFEPKTEEAAVHVHDMVEKGYFRKKDNVKFAELKTLNTKLSLLYEVREPTINVIGERVFAGGFGQYDPKEMEMFLKNYSVVTYLHEFRHHVQNLGSCSISEADAQGWACFVYYKACPVLFVKAVENNRIMGATIDGERIVLSVDNGFVDYKMLVCEDIQTAGGGLNEREVLI